MGEGKAHHQLSSPAAIAPRQRSPQAVSSLTRPRRPPPPVPLPRDHSGSANTRLQSRAMSATSQPRSGAWARASTKRPVLVLWAS